MDVVLDKGSGFDILDDVGYENMQVVICTAHDEFALRAIRYQVVGYLLKPIEIQDLIVTVNKIKAKSKSRNGKQVFDADLLTQLSTGHRPIPQRFAMSDRSSIDFVSLDDIICVETHKGKDKTAVVVKGHEKNEFIPQELSFV